MPTQETLLRGHGPELARVPAAGWRQHLAEAPAHMARRLAFMTARHRAVREAAVLWLPRNGGRPLSVARLARVTRLPAASVQEIVADLQRNLFFLVCNIRGEVAWAFPVTVERTAHRVTFSTGERLWGA